MNMTTQTPDGEKTTDFVRSAQETDAVTRVFPKHIHVSFVKDVVAKVDFILSTLKQNKFDPRHGGVLAFVHKRSDAEDYASRAAILGEKADYYHAGRESSEKEEVAEQFANGEIIILFATKAFGMGVDIKNIRYVFHLMPPSSIEDYIQEIGRAGRDDEFASAILP